MAELSHKYILLQDRVGHIVERNILSLVLSTKQSPTQVLRGELLEALPEAEQPNDSSKIALVGIDRKSLRLECGMDCIIRLTEDDANLLLAISSLGERYETYMDRIRLDLGRKIGPGSRVYVTVKGVSKVLPGVVWYKGELLACSGTMFGVELIDNPGQGTSDGTFRNKRYFTCPADSGVFVGLDKLTPRDDSISKSSKKAESHSSNIASRIKETVMPSFLKGRNEENFAQGGFENQEVEKMLKIDQRVVTFLESDRPLRGSVRFIGKDKDRNGKSRTIVGLELDTRDGCGTGKLHGRRQVFVCKTDFALFVPIEAVIPEENFDEKPVNNTSARTSERVENVEEQIRKDEVLAKSLSYVANSSGGLSPKRVRRASSVEDSASVIKAAGESSKTDPKEFIEQQKQLLDEIKSSKAPDCNDEDVVMRDDERTDSAKLNFDDKHFRNTPPNGAPITKQPGLSGTLPGYPDYVNVVKEDCENCTRQDEGSRYVMRANSGMYDNTRTPLAGEVGKEYSPEMYGNTRNTTQLVAEVVTDCSPGASNKPEVDMLSNEPTENLQSQNAMLYTEEPVAEKRTGAEGQIAVDVSHGYEVDSMVEVPMAEGLPRYGVIRWIGQLPQVKDKLVAGLELEEEQSACSDGTFNGMRYFTCPAGRGFFTLLQHCRQDSRFTSNSPNNDNSFHSDKAFGSLPSPDVQGITLPPKALEAKYRGTMHGIQGHHNSCYLDATLYSMFAFSSVFDTLLHREKRDTDLAEYDEVQRVLRESIVNPLRTTGFVRADRVLKLRELLDKLSSTAGLVNEEKDPEEFLNSLLQQVLKADPFLHLKSRDARKSDSEGAFFYQIITEKDDTVKIAQVQKLLELSFISADIILSELPSCLILQMPRFGSKYKMYDMILPNLELDVTHIVENIPRECALCGSEIAQFECRDCEKVVLADEIGITSYCAGCNSKVHSHRDRTDHRRRPVVPPRQFSNSKQIPDKPKMELFAVVCIETSHYVAFVKCGVGADAPWCFFDSMADRKGEKNGYNIPAVSDCPEALEWLSKDPKEIVAAKERGEMPQKVRRLLGDGYLCMYQDLDMTMYK